VQKLGARREKQTSFKRMLHLSSKSAALYSVWGKREVLRSLLSQEKVWHEGEEERGGSRI